MPEISLSINERNYQMTCDDGQEEHLRKLASHLDERIQGLVAAVGPAERHRSVRSPHSGSCACSRRA